MDFSLNEDQQMLQDSILRFIQDAHDFETRRKWLKQNPGLTPQLWQQFADLGWLALPFPESAGGYGGGARDLCVLMEAFGRGLVVQPYVANVLLAGHCLLRGNEQQQQTHLEPMIAGTQQLALAHQEPGVRHSPSYVAVAAEKNDKGYVLDGQKSIVLNGDQAQWLLVSARTTGQHTDAEGISLFLVPADANGVTRQCYPTADGMSAADIRLDHVQVAAEALIGNEHQALPIIEQAMDKATLAICAEAVGCMDNLVKQTVEYCNTRQQFGVPIGKFQVLQHRMVDMFIYTEQARAMTDLAAMQADGDDINEAQASLSALKAFIGQASRYTAQQAVQLHGGMGITDELAVGHYFKRLTAIGLLFGDSHWHKRRLLAA